MTRLRVLLTVSLSFLSCLTAQPAGAELPVDSPGGLDAMAPAVAANPGSTYPWEGMVGGTNTGNGNKLTTIPVVGWGARGGLPVSLALVHNSKETGVSELGPKWIHSYNI
jgi:hypothetical protein